MSDAKLNWTMPPWFLSGLGSAIEPLGAHGAVNQPERGADLQSEGWRFRPNVISWLIRNHVTCRKRVAWWASLCPNSGVKEKVKAFGYLRTVRKGQVGVDGLLYQREEVNRYAKAKRIVIVQEFSDEAVSETSDAMNRPGLTDLLVALKANGVRTVIVENAARVARDPVIFEIILGEFKKIGVRVLSAGDGIDLCKEHRDQKSTLIRGILDAAAEWEKYALVQTLRASRLRIRRSSGRCEGKKPYGHTLEEAKVVEDIVAHRKRGMSYVAIATQLNATGVKSRSGKNWHPTQVQRVLMRGSTANFAQ